MAVMFQRMEDCERRKQNKGETPQPAETRQHPLQTMPAPPITFPGHEEHAKLRDQLGATAQDCCIYPRNVPLPLQHSLEQGKTWLHTAQALSPAPSISTHSAVLTHHCRFSSAFPHFGPSRPTPALGTELPSDPHSPARSQEHRLRSSQPSCFRSCTPGRDGA